MCGFRSHVLCLFLLGIVGMIIYSSHVGGVRVQASVLLPPDCMCGQGWGTCCEQARTCDEAAHSPPSVRDASSALCDAAVIRGGDGDDDDDTGDEDEDKKEDDNDPHGNV